MNSETTVLSASAPANGSRSSLPSLRVLCAPKEGNTFEQYEDAYAYSALEKNPVTLALSDGASSAVFARDWANLLASTFVTGFPVEDNQLERSVAALGETWRSQVTARAQTWHAQEKLEYGSEATLLVVTFDREQWLWEARAVGDVCLFLVRKNKLRYAFPITKSARFDDRPALLSSRTGVGAKLPKVIRYTEKFEPGDRFLLATDALAQWLLTRFEEKQKPWNDLPTTDGLFLEWLKSERDAGRLKNDDTTLLDLMW